MRYCIHGSPRSGLPCNDCEFESEPRGREEWENLEEERNEAIERAETAEAKLALARAEIMRADERICEFLRGDTMTKTHDCACCCVTPDPVRPARKSLGQVAYEASGALRGRERDNVRRRPVKTLGEVALEAATEDVEEIEFERLHLGHIWDRIAAAVVQAHEARQWRSPDDPPDDGRDVAILLASGVVCPAYFLRGNWEWKASYSPPPFPSVRAWRELPAPPEQP